MLSVPRGQRLHAAMASVWMLTASMGLLYSALVGSSPVFPNNINVGIGVELELGWMEMHIREGTRAFTLDQQEHLKGSKMTPVGYHEKPKTNWELTADLISDKAIIPEVIVDGKIVKVGDGKLGAIGKEISDFFNEWNPSGEKRSQVNVEGTGEHNSWQINDPYLTPKDYSERLFSPQVTTAMPLGGILQILKAIKDKDKSNLLANVDGGRSPSIKLLTAKDFADFPKINQKNIDDDFLGFFSLLATYCVAAEHSTPDFGPKRIIPIMPRTDYVTQYNLVKPKLTAQLADGKTSLYDIIRKVTGSRGDALGQTTFKWLPHVTKQIQQTWIGKAEDMHSGTITVEKFLTYLQGSEKEHKDHPLQLDLVSLMDETLRHGQIGGLGAKMEVAYQSNKLVPLFEFRELPQIKGKDLQAIFVGYEETTKILHKKFAK